MTESANTTKSTQLTSGKSPRVTIPLSEAFRFKLFWMWYQSDQPNPAEFHDYLGAEGRLDPETGQMVGKSAIRNLISDWRSEAYKLDQRVIDRLKSTLVEDRVDMIKRHLPQFVELQTIAMGVLRETKMTPRTAVQAYFLGIKHEREARGIPIDEFEALDRMGEAEILEYIQRLTGENPLENTERTLQAKRASQ